ncbi:acyltransferase domain-containing protein [Streptomyces sp. NPDC017405]|uniref:acyltransferase domain-containing protein n=1 Tax=unclassified Streptomyces TaxID=2593676 RepID=UPI00379213CE
MRPAAPGRRPVALLLPGQGAQHRGMAVELYGREPVLTAVLDEFFAYLGDEGAALREQWLADPPGLEIDDASRAQPLLFAIGYALGRSVECQGIRLGALLGHSVGELAAAALAGVFGLRDAARLMRERAVATAGVPAGGMLAAAASVEELRPYLDPGERPDGVVVGARNGPRQTVLAGAEPRLTLVEERLRRHGVFCRRVAARQPFHSPAMADAVERFERAFATIQLRPPAVPVWSTRTGRRVSREQAADPGFWARQLATPVQFWPALDAMLESRDFLLVETGPGQGLSMLARRHHRVRQGHSEVVPLLPARAAGALHTYRAAVLHVKQKQSLSEL